MAIEPTMADMIRQMAVGLPNRRVLVLGFPDLLLTDPDVRQSPDADAIRKWHHWTGPIGDTDVWFADLGLTPEYWDVAKIRGPERIVDLNRPVENAGRFAMVIDAGTLEHVFDVAQAWQTTLAAVDMDGVLINCNPMALANHAFFSFHPTFYADLLEANGFKIEVLVELSGDRMKRTIRPLPKTQRYEMAAGAQVLCVSRRIAEVSFTVPLQAKYRNQMLKAAQ